MSHCIGLGNSFVVFERLNKNPRPSPCGGILKCYWRAAANSRCTLTYTLPGHSPRSYALGTQRCKIFFRSLVCVCGVRPCVCVCVEGVRNPSRFIKSIIVSGHTASKTPDPIRTRKLSCARPGQYWGGGPPGKPLGCC